MKNLLETKVQKRALAYVVVFITLFIGYFLLRDSTWQSNNELHLLMELMASILAFVIGAIALVRFYSNKENSFLFIGTGFLGTSFLEIYHTIASSTIFDIYFLSPQSSLILVWLASRLFLSILLWWSWLVWLQEEKQGKSCVDIDERMVYFITVILTIACLLFFSFISQPVDYPEMFFPRPLEFAPALFFLLALIGYLMKGHWKQDDFEHWLVLSLIIGFMGQTMFMPFSENPFDITFDIAHLLKKISYICVLIGLLINIYAVYISSKKSALQLLQTNIQLQQAKENAEKAKIEAEFANRAKSTFLANMSHELRTPLNGILGYTQILHRDKTLNTKQKEAITVIHRSGEYLLTLINDVLDLSKIEADRIELYPTDFHFENFLQNIVEIFQMRVKQKKISFVYEKLSPLPDRVHADEKRLRQIIANLLGNAVKFTKEGRVIFKVGYHNGKIRFQVEDTGIGIMAEELDKIFQPFQQVGDKSLYTEGTGLGLSITKKLVELMGGQLQVESTFGKGSIFWTTLDLPEVSHLVSVKKNKKPAIIGFEGQSRQVLTGETRKTEKENDEIEPEMREFIGPSKEQATVLFDLAMKGNLKAVVNQLEEFEQSDPKLKPFADKIRALAKNFDEEQICDLVEQYLE
jgi:signal transduction histidine kinase